MTPPRLAPEPGQALTESTFCILAALAQPRHGYAIMLWVAESTRGRVKLGPGTLYGALTTLQERGQILLVGENMEGVERRKVYVLTEAGRATLEAEVSRLEAMATMGRGALEGGVQ